LGHNQRTKPTIYFTQTQLHIFGLGISLALGLGGLDCVNCVITEDFFNVMPQSLIKKQDYLYLHRFDTMNNKQIYYFNIVCNKQIAKNVCKGTILYASAESFH